MESTPLTPIQAPHPQTPSPRVRGEGEKWGLESKRLTPEYRAMGEKWGLGVGPSPPSPLSPSTGRGGVMRTDEG